MSRFNFKLQVKHLDILVKMDFIMSSEKGHVVRFDGCHSSVANSDSCRQHSNSDDDRGKNSQPDKSAA